MNHKNLTDTALLSNTKSLVNNERELLTQILHHLREVDRRKLYSALKYKSLFEYAVKELSYSEDQAYRRINAMRLLKELPQIEEKINTGALTLSSLSVATQVFRAEVKAQGKYRSTDGKLKVLEAIENKSKREAEVIAQSLSHAPKEMLKPEFVKPLGEEHIEVRFTARKSLETKIQRLKGLLAHSHPNLSTAQLFEKLCDEFIANKERTLNKPAHQEELRQMPQQVTTHTSSRPPHPEGLRSRQFASCDHRTRARAVGRRYIPAHIKRLVWQRDKAKCCNCGSQYAIEIDHIKPHAQSGPSTPENLRLLCKSCNQRSAIELFGMRKMERYFRE